MKFFLRVILGFIHLTIIVLLGAGQVFAAGTWTEQTGSGSRGWYGITSSSDGAKLAAVNNSLGYIYTSTDSGVTWTERTGAGSRSWISITSSSDGTKLVAVPGGLGGGGYIYTSTDSGVTWTERTGAGSRGWTSITSSEDGTKLAVSDGFGDGFDSLTGYIYTSTDSGVTWTEQSGSDSRRWYSITSSSDGTKLAAVENDGYIYTSTDSGVTWTERTGAGSRGWISITSSSDGAKLAAVDNAGYIYTSTDSGVTWTERTGAGSRSWISITSSSDGTKLVAADNNGGYIYISTDSGVTWTEQTTAGARNWQSTASSADGSKLVAGVFGGFLYTYAETPADVTAPTVSTLSPLDNATGVATNANLVITFDENVDAETGNITIKRTADDTTFATIDVTGLLVSGSGTDTITINPSSNFAESTGYYVQIDATAFDDAASNSYAGIADTTTWNFTTEDAPVSSGGSSGGRSSHLQSTCKPSDRSVSVGERVSFDIDIDSSDDYTFKWTKVLSGTDEDETHKFTESGTYYPRAEIKNESGDKAVVNCGTITVSDDEDTNTDDEDEEDTTDSDIEELIKLLKFLGIEVPDNLKETLKSLNNTTTNTHTFAIDLELGDNHPDVKLLQQFLNKHNYTVSPQGPGSLGNETTIFGYATQAALIKFQQANNITPAVGYFGPKTRGVVNGM